MEKRKIPAVRFKGFEDDWEQRKLGEVIRLNGRIGFRGYTEKDIVSKDDGGVLTFSPTNIVDNKLTTNCKNTYITRFKYDESPEIKIHNGDILFVKTGSTLGKSALVTGLSEDATLNPQVVVMRTNNLNAEFLAAMLVTNTIIMQVNSAKIGGAVPTLTETRIKDFDVSIPVSEAEKEQIGKFFSQLDHLITLHQRKLEKLQLVKKSMLEKMFPKNGSKIPEIRFEGFADDWEQRKFSDLYAPLVERNSDLLPYNKTFSVATMTYKTDGNGAADSSLANYKRLRTGDIAFEGHTSKSFRYGRFVLNDVGDGIMSPRFSALRPLTQMPTNFWKYYIHYEPIMRKVLVASTKAGTMMNELVIDEFLKSSVLVPSIEEQTRIGGILKNIDHLITLHQRKLEKLKSFKKSLLEKLFVQ